MTVDFNQYSLDKRNFCNIHNYDFECNTSPMDEYGCYHKEYVFQDGSIWYEVLRPVYRDYETKVENVTIRGTVKLLECEYWTSENATSRKYYEKF